MLKSVVIVFICIDIFCTIFMIYGDSIFGALLHIIKNVQFWPTESENSSTELFSSFLVCRSLA